MKTCFLLFFAFLLLEYNLVKSQVFSTDAVFFAFNVTYGLRPLRTTATVWEVYENEETAKIAIEQLSQNTVIIEDPCFRPRTWTLCDENARCITLPGNTSRFFRCSCNNGFKASAGIKTFNGDRNISPDGLFCSDVNECAHNPGLCGNYTLGNLCVNTPGDYMCNCADGFSLSVENVCEDIDECLNATLNECAVTENCQNTEGSYICACLSGYTGDGIACADINECAVTPLICGSAVSGSCRNTNGSYECDCRAGYTLNGRNSWCQDVDECEHESLNECPYFAACVNLPGSYSCSCAEGFSGDGRSCTDINKCSIDPCQIFATCTSSNKSFTCACNTKYSENRMVCDDIDECLSDPCHFDATCNNTEGSFTCVCNSEFIGNGIDCNEINQCSTNPCHVSATCTNTIQSFTCACNSGYSGNGLECDDIDECSMNPCHFAATCNNTDGSFSCTCNSGFIENGSACDDIDECTLNKPCHERAICTNAVGSFTCQCPESLQGDGLSCKDPDQSLRYRLLVIVRNSPEGTSSADEGLLIQAVLQTFRGFSSQGLMFSNISAVIERSSTLSVEGTRVTYVVIVYLTRTRTTAAQLTGFLRNYVPEDQSLFTLSVFDECANNYDDCVAPSTCEDTDGGYICVERKDEIRNKIVAKRLLAWFYSPYIKLPRFVKILRNSRPSLLDLIRRNKPNASH